MCVTSLICPHFTYYSLLMLPKIKKVIIHDNDDNETVYVRRAGMSVIISPLHASNNATVPAMGASNPPSGPRRPGQKRHVLSFRVQGNDMSSLKALHALAVSHYQTSLVQATISPAKYQVIMSKQLVTLNRSPHGDKKHRDQISSPSKVFLRYNVYFLYKRDAMECLKYMSKANSMVLCTYSML